MRFAIPLPIVAVLLYLPAMVEAQSKRAADLGLGKVLVASRDLPDPSFAKTVILLVQFDEDGAVGLMINRRTKVPISRAFEQLKAASNRSDPIYMGGPVNMEAVMALLRTGSRPDGARRVVGGVYLVSTKPLLEKILTAGTGPSDFHAFVGYCGWGGGQLQNEMNMGGWYVFDGDAKQVFDSNPDTLWTRLIGRTEQILVRTRKPLP